MDNLIALIPLVVFVAFVPFWLNSLVNKDTGECKDKGPDCKTCPFPCEEHDKENKK